MCGGEKDRDVLLQGRMGLWEERVIRPPSPRSVLADDNKLRSAFMSCILPSNKLVIAHQKQLNCSVKMYYLTVKGIKFLKRGEDFFCHILVNA